MTRYRDIRKMLTKLVRNEEPMPDKLFVYWTDCNGRTIAHGSFSKQGRKVSIKLPGMQIAGPAYWDLQTVGLTDD